MASIKPNTFKNALDATSNMARAAGDNIFSTRTKIIGFLTLGIGFFVNLAYRHLTGAAENQTRTFIRMVPEIHQALSMPYNYNDYKTTESSPIKFDDGTQVTFKEEPAAGGKKVIVTFTSGNPAKETTQIIEDTSFNELLNKINEDIHNNMDIYKKYCDQEDFLEKCSTQYEQQRAAAAREKDFQSEQEFKLKRALKDLAGVKASQENMFSNVLHIQDEIDESLKKLSNEFNDEFTQKD